MVLRHVHFNNTKNDNVHVTIREIDSLSDFTRSEKLASWYQPSDYHYMKQMAKITARSIRDHAPNEMVSNTKHSYTQVLLAIQKSTIECNDEISTSDIKFFELWIKSGHSRRGLERWSVPTLDFIRRERQATVTRSVIDMWHHKCKCKCNDPTLQGDVGDIIALAYSEMARPACRFAQWMGQADQAAVSNSLHKMLFSKNRSNAWFMPKYEGIPAGKENQVVAQ